MVRKLKGEEGTIRRTNGWAKRSRNKEGRNEGTEKYNEKTKKKEA